ncbi:MAG: hypothetical protein N3H31_03830 [Candidatus Nezhaarchaeota archaeon]|nr:hypothetical protein [Candidatus Nezhaarchaeota archaeon]
MIRPLLAMLSLAIVIMPIIHGLYLHNFSLIDYLSPRLGGAEEVLRTLAPRGVEVRYEGFRVIEVDLDRGRVELEVTLSLHNSLPLALRIEDLSFYVYCGTHGEGLAVGRLNEPVEAPPGERGLVSVNVRSTAQGGWHVRNYHVRATERGTVVDFIANVEDASIILSVGGVRVEVVRADLGSVPIRFTLQGAAP